ncbi:MAG TPA: redoxin family protein [Planctomycetota bacterium]|nr:redoxin family protein [Planctomycetota bacterium]
MMKTRTLVLCVAIGLPLAACKFIARQIVAHRDAWANGLTQREGQIEDGIQVGEWAFYYESGQRRAKGRYENDHQVGPWTYYYENGVTEWSGAFDAEGRRTGEWTFHYPDDTLRARGNYIADFEDGAWEFFGQDSLLERSGQYDGGKLSGPWKYFYPGGKPKAAGLCHRGQRIGPWQVWDEAGAQVTQDFGTKAGIQIVQEKWPDGTVRRIGVLQNGAPVGRWTCYHENGKPRFSCTVQDGRASGVFEARDASGNLIAQGVLRDGQFVEGSLAMQGGQTRAIAAGPVPPANGSGADWADAAKLLAMPPEAAVGELIAEARASIEPASLLAKVAEPTAPPPAPVAAVVQEIEAAPDRIPAQVQPDLTVTQREEIDSYVLNYLDGPSKSRVSRKKYGPAGGGAKASGPRRRTELEGKPLPVQVLRCVDGTEVDLRQYIGKKRLLVVILRGFLGEVCVYCVAQTEALAQCRERLAQLGIEVFVVYPGAKENEQCFEQAYEMTFGKGAPPYRVFYDPDLEVVQQLGISGDLAYPTTLIVDKDGLVQYAYVGEHRADRPAAKELIKVIEGMQQ